jgi:hypothetical protein
MTVNWWHVLAGAGFSVGFFSAGFGVGIMWHARYIEREARKLFLEQVEREES